MRSLKIGRLLLAAPLLASVALALPPTTQAAKTKVLKPTVTTGGFTQPRGTSATLLGTVNPRGAATTYHFDYGPTIAYGKQTAPANLPAGIVKVKVGQPATGLLAGYHYRVVATNERGTANGRDRTFTVKSTRTTKFALVKPAEATVLGGALTLTGTLSGTGGGNRRIELQQSPFPFLVPFSVVGLPIVTNAAGAFSFHVTGLLLSTQFRVNTLDPRPLYSPVVTQHVAARVTLESALRRAGGSCACTARSRPPRSARGSPSNCASRRDPVDPRRHRNGPRSSPRSSAASSSAGPRRCRASAPS